MFEIEVSETGRIHLAGRFHAAHAQQAQDVFKMVSESCVVSFASLEYISSAGLTVLLAAQKRLKERGHALRLVDMRPPIKNVFLIAGFDAVFEIE